MMNGLRKIALRTTLAAASCGIAATTLAGPASADATDDFPIPHRMIRLAASGFASANAFTRRPISGKR